MKTQLPNINSHKGFTLIELLVVIAIIAVLAVIGFAVFNGLTTRGNDSRRQTDIKSIADAYEVKRGTASSYNNLALAATDFSGGILPADPGTYSYCIKTGTTVVANAGVVTAGDGITAAGACSGAFAAVSTAALPATNVNFFKICVLLSDASVKCVGSKQ